MNQAQRSLLAGVLSLLVFFLWYEFYAKKMTPPVPASVTSNVVAPPPAGGTAPITAAKPTSMPVGEEKVVHKENDLFEITFSSYGGRIKGFRLKTFHITAAKESPLVDLLSAEGSQLATLTCRDCNFEIPDTANYRLVEETPNQLVFETSTASMTLRKTYQWFPDQYRINLKISLANHSPENRQGVLGLQLASAQKAEQKKGFLSFLRQQSTHNKNFVYRGEGKTERFGQKEGSKGHTGNIAWAGIEEQYFVTALIARRLSSDQVLEMSRSAENFNLAFFPSRTVISPQGVHEEEFSLYLGPKDRQYLQVVGVGLEEAVDYGWFGLVALPIAKLLKFFYNWVGNWGVSIIILTLFVKILMNPLSIKSLQQMKEMQKLQPELQRLKEKYKDDRQRLNTETMQLFKTHKVNPMGGCLPMVLQMPIYIALYKVLYNSIEIYHAPFVWFYRDLSAPDPYFILPILLGVSMVAQQKLTPQTSTDPTQKQMMMIMPVMFTAFMLFLPVGLVLYIFVNTLMSVIQQYMSQKDIRWRDLARLSARTS